jgi:hypothetical protein
MVTPNGPEAAVMPGYLMVSVEAVEKVPEQGQLGLPLQVRQEPVGMRQVEMEELEVTLTLLVALHQPVMGVLAEVLATDRLPIGLAVLELPGK